MENNNQTENKNETEEIVEKISPDFRGILLILNLC